jgi:transitional endoplasmic reticulum ATPase
MPDTQVMNDQDERAFADLIVAIKSKLTMDLMSTALEGASKLADTKPQPKIVDRVTVVQHGNELVIPESLPLRRAAEVLLRKAEYDEQVVAPRIVIPGFIPEVAWACHEILNRKFGIALAIATKTMFGDRPPMSLNVKTGVNTSVQVPWGEFEVPGIDGKLSFGADYDGTSNRFVFILGGKVPRKFETVLNEIADETKKLLRGGAIMKGKAWGIKLRDNEGEPNMMPDPRFFDPDPDVRGQLVFGEFTDDSIDTNIFAILEDKEGMRAEGVPLKRGILLYGDYGTGKTMVMTATADAAIRNGWTHINCDDPREFADVVRLARDYQPCVVTTEDLDQVTSGERTIELDDILNTIDGIESKGTEIMIVVTTNHVDKINKSVLRPGRLDAMIHVAPPDAEAAIRMLRQYGGKRIDPALDLTDLGVLLAGNKAATIREVAERSKVRARRRKELSFVSLESLLRTANEVLEEERLRAVVEPDLRSDREKSAESLAKAISELANTAPITALPVAAVSANEIILD